MGLNQVRRVAGESDEDREVRLQALRTKKVLDPGSVPLEFVVSVLVTVVSFTLTSFSSHLIVGGRGDAVMPIMSVYRLNNGTHGFLLGISMCGVSKKPSVQKLWRGKANMQMSWSSAFAQFRDQRNAAAT